MPKGVKGPSKPGAAGKKLVALISCATQEDLDLLDSQVLDLEAQLKGLRALRECLAERVLNVPAAPKSKKIDVLAVATFLRHNGPSPLASIAKQLNVDSNLLEVAMTESLYFDRKYKTWSLTSEGDAAIEESNN